jgi:hypothetical protein
VLTTLFLRSSGHFSTDPACRTGVLVRRLRWTGALVRLGLARANSLQSRTSQGADADPARVRALAAYKFVRVLDSALRRVFRTVSYDD